MRHARRDLLLSLPRRRNASFPHGRLTEHSAHPLCCLPCACLQTYTWQEAFAATLQTYYNATLEQLTTAQVRGGRGLQGPVCGGGLRGGLEASDASTHQPCCKAARNWARGGATLAW